MGLIIYSCCKMGLCEQTIKADVEDAALGLYLVLLELLHMV